MKFIKIKMDLGNPSVRRSLADAQILHRNIQSLFNDSRAGSKVLFRRNKDTLYVSANKEPVISEKNGLKVISVSESAPREAAHTYRFNLLTQPYRKHNSNRMPILDPDERIEWLHRQAEKGGFSLVSIKEDGREIISSKIKSTGEKDFLITAYCYSGMLRVENEELFNKTVIDGIGASKAYGLGMLLTI